MGDLRLAVRSLLRRPGFSAAVVATLTLAIGVTTGFFGVANALLLRPLKGVEARGLVSLHVTHDGRPQGFSGFSRPAFLDFRERTRTLAGLEAFVGRGFALGDGTKTSVVGGQLVSGGFFRLLGTRAHQGRLLGDEDDAGEPRHGGHQPRPLAGGWAAARTCSARPCAGSRPFTVVALPRRVSATSSGSARRSRPCPRPATSPRRGPGSRTDKA
jgi:hypothetical protein